MKSQELGLSLHDKTEKELEMFVKSYTVQKPFFKLGFTPCKAEQPLQGMELQEKETQKD